MKKINIQTIKPQVEEIDGVDDPTAVRYGWMPFKSVYLYNGDGTPCYYIQPVNSPYHREIPKNQLIAFETFAITRRKPLEGQQTTPGTKAGYVTETETKTAYECATVLLRGYADRGYTVLNSLQGLPQEDAGRIFQVVQPLDYKLGELVGELSFADERIEATEPMDFSQFVDGDDPYIVQPLRNEAERQIAKRLVAEMLTGAERAQTFALEKLDETEKDLIAVASGRKEGKRGADPLDKYLESEMSQPLPNMYGKAKAEVDMQRVAEKVDFLVEREQTREMKEENERLRAEIEELRALKVGGEIKTSSPDGETVAPAKCDYVRDGGAKCNGYAIKGQTRCGAHKDK